MHKFRLPKADRVNVLSTANNLSAFISRAEALKAAWAQENKRRAKQRQDDVEFFNSEMKKLGLPGLAN